MPLEELNPQAPSDIREQARIKGSVYRVSPWKAID